MRFTKSMYEVSESGLVNSIPSWKRFLSLSEQGVRRPPFDYFNASHQGMAQVFAPFTLLSAGVEPFQMPAFALRAMLNTYLVLLGHVDDPAVDRLRASIRDLCDQPLGTIDGFLNEDAALFIAAGTYYFGVKLPLSPSRVIPPILVSLWERRADLRARLPTINNVGTGENILLWARNEGRPQVDAIAAHFDGIVPFRKRGQRDDHGQEVFDELPVVQPRFQNIQDGI